MATRAESMPPPDLSRLRRHVWNWLPAFLEVAETGSIKRAASSLHLTPAAVSRTLRLLQDELGAPLFNRAGRALVLNATGAALRDTVRRASATVDGGLVEALGDPFVGPLRVASLGILTEHFVVPGLLELKAHHRELSPEHLNIGPVEANTQIVRGQIDVAFYYEEITATGVATERVGEATTSVYCGRGHPLYAATRVTRDAVLQHPFSVPQIGDSGRVMDGWPNELPRSIGMRITLLRSNLDVCRSGLLLTVLPDVTALPHVRTKELRRLPAVELPVIEMFAARSASAPARDATEELVSAVRRRVTEASAEVRTLRRGR